MQYDGDLQLPKHFLVSPPVIERTLGEYLVHNGRHQLAISETQKFGHVTYFWNGNRSGMIDPAYESYVEVPSDRVSFSERPFMKAAEITDGLIEQLEKGTIAHARLNFANGDMVGHTGDREASIIAVEAVDLCLGRILPVIERLGGALITTADHGNADEMFELDKRGQPQLNADGRPVAKTSHTLNQVPFYVYAPSLQALSIDPAIVKPRLSNIAGSVLQLMGWAPPSDFDPGLLKLR
jgi:2,3-bisphosphoglycerate-independent phosphoglycerate mutase